MFAFCWSIQGYRVAMHQFPVLLFTQQSIQLLLVLKMESEKNEKIPYWREAFSLWGIQTNSNSNADLRVGLMAEAAKNRDGNQFLQLIPVSIHLQLQIHLNHT